MKTTTAVVIGIFTIVLVFFAFGLRSTAVSSGQAAAVSPAGLLVNGGAQDMTGTSATSAAQAGAQAPMLVQCGPGQQTLVRQVWMNGQQVPQVACVPSAAAGYASGASQVRTIAYETQADDSVVYAPRAPRVYRSAPVSRRVSQPRRDWKKTALVIGGSTAAGAGIGGAIGGKKGALIGAAIGGGASTLFEATRRH